METVVNILLWVAFGLVAGAIAKFLMPGRDPGGILTTIVLGIAGAFLGGMLGRALGLTDAVGAAGTTPLDWRSLLMAIGGAPLLLAAYRAFRMVAGTPEPTPLGFTSGASGHAATGPNLTENLRHAITPDVVDRLSDTLGESPTNTKKALEAIPTVLAGAASYASTSTGAARLLDTAKETAQGGTDLVSNLAGQINGSGLESLNRTGQGVLGWLFGDKLSGLVDWFCRFAGIKTASASALMGVATSLVMNGLGKHAMQHGLNAAGLGNLLSGQRSWLARFLPSGITDIPGLGTLASYVGQAGEAIRGAARQGERAVRGAAQEAYQGAMGITKAPTPWLNALLPLLLLGLGLLALPFVMKGCATQTPIAHTTVRDTSIANIRGNIPERTGEKDTSIRVAGYGPNVSEFTKITMPDGVNIEIPKGSFLQHVHQYLTSAATAEPRSFTFEGLEFDGVGVKMTSGIDDYARAVATLLKAFPRANLRIESHVDNQGDVTSHQRMTQERADAVKAFLVRFGAPADRIAAVGIGSEKPIAPNDNAEGRAKNRRTELLIVRS